MDTALDYCEHPAVTTRDYVNRCDRCGDEVHTPAANDHPYTRSGNRAAWVPIRGQRRADSAPAFVPEWRRRSLEGRRRFDAVTDTTDVPR